MRWDDWQLIVEQHPPILRNKCWPKDVKLEDNLHALLAEIIEARRCDLAGENADVLGLVDAISAIVKHGMTLGEGATIPLAAYSYAAFYRT